MHKVSSAQPASQNLRPFRPGQMAPISGIYRVIHKIPHRPAHEVMAIRGEHFPTCRICQGRVEFRVDKTGNVHAPVGKVSFSPAQLADNVSAFMDTILRAKPSAAKGVYIRSATISSTMGPGVRLDTAVYR